MLIFTDNQIENLNVNNKIDFRNLFVHYLCGKNKIKELELEKELQNILDNIILDVNKYGINYEQLNEILLFFNQNRVSEGFFSFFFLSNEEIKKSKIINIKKFKKGIIKFRGYCLLHYGNFKNSFKNLSRASIKEIKEELKDIYIVERNLIKEYEERPEPIVDLKTIDKDKTWYLGYITQKQLKREREVFKELLENPECTNPSIYKSLGDNLLKKNKESEETKKKGKINTSAYLIWDYIDVYIATSMRNKSHFEETFEFINSLSKNKKISKLNLRIFDPTQSHTDLIRDKGLIEGLMLKRAKCTIYMVQEFDTMGKDSELASTLAQKKPVIAYIPKYDIDDLTSKIKYYELEEILKKIYVFKSKRIFRHKEFIAKIDVNIEVDKIIELFIKEYNTYRDKQQFTLWDEKEIEFKKKFPQFSDLCKILAIATQVSLDKREEILKDSHPLGMQIDLNSGVANGVLVIRDIVKCINLLIDILTNSMEFEINYENEYTGLFEKKSGSIYRIVTHDDIITNSFWNFFYKIKK